MRRPEGTGPPEYPGSRPGPPSVLGNFFNGLCSTISSCFYIVCCCWFLQGCFGAPPEPPPIRVAPPQAPPPALEPFPPPPSLPAVPIGPPQWAPSGPPGSPRDSPPGLPPPY